MLGKIDIRPYTPCKGLYQAKNDNLPPCLGYSCQETFKASRYPQTFIEDDHCVLELTVVVERLRLDEDRLETVGILSEHELCCSVRQVEIS